MSRTPEDVGEATIALQDDAGQVERRLYVRLGGLLLLAVILPQLGGLG